MKRVLLCTALVIFCTSSAYSQGQPVLHKFSYWGTLENPLEKIDFLTGFTNGFFAGPRPRKFVSLAMCWETSISLKQAMTMIDKYYQAHPEKWDVPVATGIVSALTVVGGPCAENDPWR
jgi:hypothetical protein